MQAAKVPSMYVRVKRQRTTIFLSVEPSDTVDSVKSELEKLTGIAMASQRLYKDDLVSEVENENTLAESGVETGNVLALAVQKENGDWESPEIVPMEEGSDDEEE